MTLRHIKFITVIKKKKEMCTKTHLQELCLTYFICYFDFTFCLCFIILVNYILERNLTATVAFHI